MARFNTNLTTHSKESTEEIRLLNDYVAKTFPRLMDQTKRKNSAYLKKIRFERNYSKNNILPEVWYNLACLNDGFMPQSCISTLPLDLVYVSPSDKLYNYWLREYGNPSNRFSILIPEKVDDFNKVVNLNHINKLIKNGKILLHNIDLNSTHPENFKLTANRSAWNAFEYLNSQLHIIRVRMIGDICMDEIRRRIANGQPKVTLINFGPGPMPLEKYIYDKLPKKYRQKVEMIGIDVCEELLRFGVNKGYIDKGIVADVSLMDSDELSSFLVSHNINVDILVFAEILEHIKSSGIVFRDGILQIIKKNNSLLVGSVPNSIQFHETLAIIKGIRSPHQLEAPLSNADSGHVSFYTGSSLIKLMTTTWGFPRENISVAGPGIRIGFTTENDHHASGAFTIPSITRNGEVKFGNPTAGDRLIFTATFDNEMDSKTKIKQKRLIEDYLDRR